MSKATEMPDMCQPVSYVICVRGILNDTWADLHMALNITVDHDAGGPSTTELTGILKDQAQLVGLIMRLYDQGYPILSITYLPAPSSLS
jgi:hypothetical protein